MRNQWRKVLNSISANSARTISVIISTNSPLEILVILDSVEAGASADEDERAADAKVALFYEYNN
jgi:hypothetical protein